MLGGVLEVLVLMVVMFVMPISEFSFFTSMISKLYRARTKDRELFTLKKA